MMNKQINNSYMKYTSNYDSSDFSNVIRPRAITYIRDYTSEKDSAPNVYNEKQVVVNVSQTTKIDIVKRGIIL